MIESIGESRWLDVEARERVELDLINWFLKRKSTRIPVQYFSWFVLPAEARKFTPPKCWGCLGSVERAGGVEGGVGDGERLGGEQGGAVALPGEELG